MIAFLFSEIVALTVDAVVVNKFHIRRVLEEEPLERFAFVFSK